MFRSSIHAVFAQPASTVGVTAKQGNDSSVSSLSSSKRALQAAAMPRPDRAGLGWARPIVR